MEQPIQIEDEVQFLDPKRVKITRNQFAELEAELPDGSVHAPVEPVRVFPLTQPNQYISLLDAHKNELGLIEDINQLKKSDRDDARGRVGKMLFYAENYKDSRHCRAVRCYPVGG